MFEDDEIDCRDEMMALLEIYKTGRDDAKEDLDDGLHTMMFYMKSMVEKYERYQDFNHKYQDLKEKMSDDE